MMSHMKLCSVEQRKHTDEHPNSDLSLAICHPVATIMLKDNLYHTSFAERKIEKVGKFNHMIAKNLFIFIKNSETKEIIFWKSD